MKRAAGWENIVHQSPHCTFDLSTSETKSQEIERFDIWQTEIHGYFFVYFYILLCIVICKFKQEIIDFVIYEQHKKVLNQLSKLENVSMSGTLFYLLWKRLNAKTSLFFSRFC